MNLVIEGKYCRK